MDSTQIEPAAHTGSSLIMNLVKAFQDSLVAGEPWLFIIFVTLIFAVAFVIERFWRLFMSYSVDGPSLMFEVQKYILANDIDGAIRICNGASNAALARVLKAGLQRASRSEDQIQNAIDATSLEVIPKIERRLSFLAMIANVATLMGLLGTIAGLIKSFQGIALADPAQRQFILSQGIAEAMNATALGLITAIFTMIFHSILANRANRLIEDIDEFGVKLMDLLSARRGQKAGARE